MVVLPFINAKPAQLMLPHHSMHFKPHALMHNVLMDFVVFYVRPHANAIVGLQLGQPAPNCFTHAPTPTPHRFRQFKAKTIKE